MRRASHGTLAAAALLFSGCAASHAGPPPGAPPALVVGTFEDDYGIGYTISEDLWRQQPGSAFRAVRWDAEAQTLIAQATTPDSTGRNLWARIDWIELPGMAPYTWAFCYTAYAAVSAEAAAATPSARRETPRTGCNGFPFSRMKPRP